MVVTIQHKKKENEMTSNAKNALDAAVREYEIAIMRIPSNEEEIRQAVNKCADAREKFNSHNAARTDSFGGGDGCASGGGES